MTALGVIFPPDQPPERLREAATAAEHAGLDELWLWEDCFAEAGVSAAAAALAWTERIRVGIGLMPTPLRNVALAAMEVATLERLFPGRVLPGIGHGVQEWMGQTGARVESPMTLLREYAGALSALLDGESVTTSGRYVRLDDVRLAWPPSSAPPVLIGGVGPKTLAVAGELGSGAIFTGGTSAEDLRRGVETVRTAREGSGRSGAPEIVTFLDVALASSVDDIAARVREHAEAGATRTAVLGIADDGRPVSDDELLPFVETLAGVGAQLAREGAADTT